MNNGSERFYNRNNHKDQLYFVINFPSPQIYQQ